MLKIYIHSLLELPQTWLVCTTRAGMILEVYGSQSNVEVWSNSLGIFPLMAGTLCLYSNHPLCFYCCLDQIF